MITPDFTASELLAGILAALLMQVAAGAAVAVWRRPRALAAAVATPSPVTKPLTEAAWSGLREFRVASRQYEDRALSQCSFRLEPVDARSLPEFRPGQFLTFVLQTPTNGNLSEVRAVTRCYSLSDAPASDHYRVTIKRVPPPADRPGVPGGVSSNHFHDLVQVGDVLQVRAPAGHFFIDPDPTVPVVLIAGGIGITPMMSMLNWCLNNQPARSVYLFYGVREGREQAFKPQLEALAKANPSFKLHVVYSRPAVEDQVGTDFQHTGHVDIALLQRTLPLRPHQFYICGPAALMESLVPGLAAWGVKDADVHFEAFGPASVRRLDAQPQALSDATDLAVHFTRSGRTITWNGTDANLLDFAERHGVAVESGCRAGSCGSCQTRLVAGSVQYSDEPDFEVEANHCLLCVGRPTSALELEA